MYCSQQEGVGREGQSEGAVRCCPPPASGACTHHIDLAPLPRLFGGPVDGMETEGCRGNVGAAQVRGPGRQHRVLHCLGALHARRNGRRIDKLCASGSCRLGAQCSAQTRGRGASCTALLGRTTPSFFAGNNESALTWAIKSSASSALLGCRQMKEGVATNGRAGQCLPTDASQRMPSMHGGCTARRGTTNHCWQRGRLPEEGSQCPRAVGRRHIVAA